MPAVASAQLAPYVAAQLLAGPVADRLGLRRAYVGGNAIGAVGVAVPACYALDALTLPVLLGLVVAAGLFRGIAVCAHAPLVPVTAELGGVARAVRLSGVAAARPPTGTGARRGPGGGVRPERCALRV